MTLQRPPIKFDGVETPVWVSPRAFIAAWAPKGSDPGQDTGGRVAMIYLPKRRLAIGMWAGTSMLSGCRRVLLTVTQAHPEDTFSRARARAIVAAARIDANMGVDEGLTAAQEVTIYVVRNLPPAMSDYQTLRKLTFIFQRLNHIVEPPLPQLTAWPTNMRSELLALHKRALACQIRQDSHNIRKMLLTFQYLNDVLDSAWYMPTVLTSLANRDRMGAT